MMKRRSTSIHRKRSALTLVEILVVIVIITIIASAFVVATSTLLDKSRTRNTMAVLQVVADAVESFKREQEANPTFTRAIQGANLNRVTYRRRYGLYPPDELEVFTSSGLPGSKPPGGSLAGSSVIMPDPSRTKWEAMRYYTDSDYEKDAIEHRELAALIIAIELYSEVGAAALSKLPDRNRTPGPVNASGTPTLYLNRSSGGGTDDDWSEEDFQIRYIVDGWGVPISYLAQRDFKKGKDRPVSSNHPKWNEASTEIIRMNRGQPLIFSYGPDGKDQLTREWMVDQPATHTAGESMPAKASLITDFEDDHKVNHLLNADNVYLDPTLKDRLNKGI